MNYYKRHIGDYLRDTAHLSLLEHGVYTRLMDLYYTREAPLPTAQECYRLIGARSREERAAVDAVLAEFFQATASGFRQTRCDAEIQAAADKAQRNRTIGKGGGRPRKTETRTGQSGNPEITQTVSELKPTENPDGLFLEPTENPSHKPLANNQETPLPPAGGGDRFAEFWACWPSTPRKVGKAACLDRWKRRRLDAHADTILAEVARLKASEQWQKGFEPAPLTYLNQRRWEDSDGGEGPEAPLYAVA